MNRKKTSMGRKVFLAVDVIVILLLCLICMVPLLNLLAYSFSASQPIIENKVFLALAEGVHTESLSVCAGE